MNTFELKNGYKVLCEYKKTRNGFKHTATLVDQHENERLTTKECYLNRTWESYTYQTVAHKAIRKLFKPDVAQELIADLDAQQQGRPNTSLNMVKLACLVGSVMTETPEDKAAWNKRMLKTVPGIEFPDNFDDLPIEEQNKRLDAALKEL